ncbi:type II toxin-antitoxin system HicB family antitoxin [Scytonema sp. UIC 10036]|uniref:type II toxin-antitoxin system HicB family antitoxin n=1 Tax=Scytonema sp. UIC 10036 TaxID=2304196 RepID=UPI0012DA2EE2|nr:type II toxin-antitoxin system HicB family antitoxin [Scytonema sp. UIC 10036]MUH01470.1 type II toxin-antitoxin system HicB family antitoxin [Scytonema sp. UIC 10036]
MQYQVFVRSQSESCFVASVVGIPNLTVEGRTEEEAIANAQAALESQLATGRLVTIEVNSEERSNGNMSLMEKPFYETATDEEWEAALIDLANSDFFSKALPLSDEAISRESIYREREDSQL